MCRLLWDRPVRCTLDTPSHCEPMRSRRYCRTQQTHLPCRFCLRLQLQPNHCRRDRQSQLYYRSLSADIFEWTQVEHFHKRVEQLQHPAPIFHHSMGYICCRRQCIAATNRLQHEFRLRKEKRIAWNLCPFSNLKNSSAITGQDRNIISRLQVLRTIGAHFKYLATEFWARNVRQRHMFQFGHATNVGTIQATVFDADSQLECEEIDHW